MLIDPLGEVPSIPKLKCWWKKSADHLGCTNICKRWDKLPAVSGTIFLLSTVFMRFFFLSPFDLQTHKSESARLLRNTYALGLHTYVPQTSSHLKCCYGMRWVDFPNKDVHEFSEYFSPSGWPILSFGWCRYRKTLKPRPWGKDCDFDRSVNSIVTLIHHSPTNHLLISWMCNNSKVSIIAGCEGGWPETDAPWKMPCLNFQYIKAWSFKNPMMFTFAVCPLWKPSGQHLFSIVIVTNRIMYNIYHI